jgi:rare lipoprotein A
MNADGKRRRRLLAGLGLVALVLLSACVHHRRRAGAPHIPSRDREQEVVSSWYGKEFNGKPTASGEIFNMYGLTAAHRTLPLGTVVKVTNLDNGRQAVLTINDRGPFVKGRGLDCSYGAAKALGFVSEGLAHVRIQVLDRATELPKSAPTPGETLVGGPGTSASLLDASFTVQVGAFQNEQNALRFRDRMAERYGDAYVIRFRDFYRVRVGHLPTEAAAEALKEKIQTDGVTGFVTVND